jgi:hypothetical protein
MDVHMEQGIGDCAARLYCEAHAVEVAQVFAEVARVHTEADL